MNGLVFRVGDGFITPIPGSAKDAGCGSIIVTDCTEGDVHLVARMIKQYVKSSAHVNACDVAQTVSWQSILAAMQEENTAAIAIVRED